MLYIKTSSQTIQKSTKGIVQMDKSNVWWLEFLNFQFSYLKSFSYKIQLVCKVEKILKGSLDSIPSPSPSMKIQIIGRKVCLKCEGKTLLGVVNKSNVFKQISPPIQLSLTPHPSTRGAYFESFVSHQLFSVVLFPYK